MLLKVVKRVVDGYRDKHITMDQLKESLEVAHDEIKWEVMHAVAQSAIEYLAESGPGRNVKITITEDFLEIDCGTNRRNSAETVSQGIFSHLTDAHGDNLDDDYLQVEVQGNVIIVKIDTGFDNSESYSSTKRHRAPRFEEDTDGDD